MWNALVPACTCAGALRSSHLAQAGLKMLHHRGPGLHSPAWNWLQLHQSGVIRLWPQGPWADPRGPGLDVQGHWWCQRGEDAHKSLALLTRIPSLAQRGTDELTVFPHQHACITWGQLALTSAGTRDLCWIALDSYNCLNLHLRPTAVRPAFCTSGQGTDVRMGRERTATGYLPLNRVSTSVQTSGKLAASLGFEEPLCTRHIAAALVVSGPLRESKELCLSSWRYI